MDPIVNANGYGSLSDGANEEGASTWNAVNAHKQRFPKWCPYYPHYYFITQQHFLLPPHTPPFL
jgi:hypothetical protein